MLLLPLRKKDLSWLLLNLQRVLLEPPLPRAIRRLMNLLEEDGLTMLAYRKGMLVPI